MRRRDFLTGALATTAVAGLSAAPRRQSTGDTAYRHHGRTSDYEDFQIIDAGRKIKKIESFTTSDISIVRVETEDGAAGFGQISAYDADLSALVLHRMLAPHFLGADPASIDALVDHCVESTFKYPWSFSCRALAGIETAIWDLYGKIEGKPVVELLGSKARPYLVYGSSMSRTIKPADEAARLKRLRDEHGYRAFKVRVGKVNGHDVDMWPGRSETLLPTVRQAVGEEIDLLVDGNSGYTPDKAIEIGRVMEDHGYHQFEEPCPYWELEWTKAVTDALDIPVSGGEQDNDLAQWRRMIAMRVVDIVQPDVCYLGGLTRTLRVAKMAAEAGIPCVPHSANLSLVTVFSVHLLGAIPNAAPYLEYTIEPEDINRQARELFSPQLVVEDGAVQIPSAPGWGIEIHRSWLERSEYRVSQL